MEIDFGRKPFIWCWWCIYNCVLDVVEFPVEFLKKVFVWRLGKLIKRFSFWSICTCISLCSCARSKIIFDSFVSILDHFFCVFVDFWFEILSLLIWVKFLSGSFTRANCRRSWPRRWWPLSAQTCWLLEPRSGCHRVLLFSNLIKILFSHSFLKSLHLQPLLTLLQKLHWFLVEFWNLCFHLLFFFQKLSLP